MKRNEIVEEGSSSRKGFLNQTITKENFNDFDSMVFSDLAGFGLDNDILSQPGSSASFDEVIDVILENAKDKIPKEQVEYFKGLKNSRRYDQVNLSDYCNYYDRKSFGDFRAVTAHLPDGTIIPSYAGTDIEIRAWIENLLMAKNKTGIESQKEALIYFEKVANKNPKESIILTGYSKGGNLEVYASYFVSEEIKNRIIRIYSNDAPGFSEAMINNLDYQKANNDLIDRRKIRSPENSLVSRILEQSGEIQYFSCGEEKGLLKIFFDHDWKNWEYNENGNLILVDKPSEISNVANEILDRVVNVFKSEEEVVMFAELLVKFCDENGIITVEHFGEFLNNNPLEIIEKVMIFYNALNEEEQKFLKEKFGEILSWENISAVLGAFINENPGLFLGVSLGAVILPRQFLAIVITLLVLVTLGVMIDYLWDNRKEILEKVKSFADEAYTKVKKFTMEIAQNIAKEIEHKLTVIFGFLTMMVTVGKFANKIGAELAKIALENFEKEMHKIFLQMVMQGIFFGFNRIIGIMISQNAVVRVDVSAMTNVVGQFRKLNQNMIYLDNKLSRVYRSVMNSDTKAKENSVASYRHMTQLKRSDFMISKAGELQKYPGVLSDFLREIEKI